MCFWKPSSGECTTCRVQPETYNVHGAGGGPRVNHKASLQEGCLAFRQTEEEAGVSTDKQDIALLYSLCQ